MELSAAQCDRPPHGCAEREAGNGREHERAIRCRGREERPTQPGLVDANRSPPEASELDTAAQWERKSTSPRDPTAGGSDRPQVELAAELRVRRIPSWLRGDVEATSFRSPRASRQHEGTRRPATDDLRE